MFDDFISLYLINQILKDPEFKVVIPKKDELIPIKMDLNFYKEKIIKRSGGMFMYNLKSYPYAYISVILKEIAIEIDKHYKNHISENPEIWAVDITHNRVVQMNKETIKSYRTFAAFRKKSHAETALKIISPLLEELYSNKHEEK